MRSSRQSDTAKLLSSRGESSNRCDPSTVACQANYVNCVHILVAATPPSPAACRVPALIGFEIII